MLLSEEIGRKIRKYRQDAGLSQEKLAEMVGVTFQQIQKYESGQTTLNVVKLQKIANSLKVAVADLFSSEPTNYTRLTDEEDLLLETFRRVKDKELRRCVLKLICNIKKRTK